MSNDYCEHIADILSSWGDVSYRSMFGGFGLYKNNQIFAITSDDLLYLKADKQSQHFFEDENSTQFIYEAKNKTIKMSYWSAPDIFFDSSENAIYFAEISYQAGLRSKKNKKIKHSS